jgi:ketosteroid isomerase-like protein
MADSPAVTLAQRLYEAVNAEDVGPFLDMCAPDATVTYPAAGQLPYGGAWHGRAAIAEFLDAHEAAEEILVFEFDEMTAVDSTVFVLGRFEGRARSTGRLWSTTFVHVLTFQGELLHSWVAFFDTAAAVAAHRA